MGEQKGPRYALSEILTPTINRDRFFPNEEEGDFVVVVTWNQDIQDKADKMLDACMSTIEDIVDRPLSKEELAILGNTFSNIVTNA